MTLRSVPRQLRFDGDVWVKPRKLRPTLPLVLRVVDQARLAVIRDLAPEIDDPHEVELLARIYFDDADNYEIAVSMGHPGRTWVQEHLRTIASGLHLRRKGRHLRPAITAELVRRERARAERPA